MENALVDDFVHATAEAEDGTRFEARQSGLYRSRDGGETWQMAYESLELEQALPTTAVALSPEYTRDGKVFAGVAGGILLSEDGGQEWQFVAFPEPTPIITALAASPAFGEDGILLAATIEDGVFLSQNRGLSWSAWNFGLQDWCVLSLALSPDFANDRTVFIGTESGVWRSSNGGKRWQELPFPSQAPVQQIVLSEAYPLEPVIQVETESGEAYRSEDDGASWKQV